MNKEGRCSRHWYRRDGVAPSEGERKFRVRVENSLTVVVKDRDIPVWVVKFLSMDCCVDCSRVV